MTDGSANYWDDRVDSHGHTGWSSPLIFGYDQALRLAAIRDAVTRIAPNAGRIVDYGCGTGDFTRMLAEIADEVVGFDISSRALARARDETRVTNVLYTERSTELFCVPADIILSVTVLQHIVDDAVLREVLRTFSDGVTDGGFIVLLESFADNDREYGYIRLRTLNNFLRMCADAGFLVVEDWPWANPEVNPTDGYRRACKHPYTRLLAKGEGHGVPTARWLLRNWLNRYARKDSGIVAEPSLTRLIVLRRIAASPSL